MLTNLFIQQLLESNFGEFSFKDENIKVTLKVKQLEGDFYMWLYVRCRGKFTYGCNKLKVEGYSKENILRNQIIEIGSQLTVVGYNNSAKEILKAIS